MIEQIASEILRNAMSRWRNRNQSRSRHDRPVHASLRRAAKIPKPTVRGLVSTELEIISGHRKVIPMVADRN